MDIAIEPMAGRCANRACDNDMDGGRFVEVMISVSDSAEIILWMCAPCGAMLEVAAAKPVPHTDGAWRHAYDCPHCNGRYAPLCDRPKSVGETGDVGK